MIIDIFTNTTPQTQQSSIMTNNTAKVIITSENESCEISRENLIPFELKLNTYMTKNKLTKAYNHPLCDELTKIGDILYYTNINLCYDSNYKTKTLNVSYGAFKEFLLANSS